jgi:1-acyl-sn-glycerol-3-phosphate acyltransferase
MKPLKVIRAMSSTAYRGRQVLQLTQNHKSWNIQAQAHSIFQSWAQDLCRIFEIRIHLEGEALDSEAGLFVGNHASYLDIPVICSQMPMSFVAKAEMRKWPVVGKASLALGTIFHDRQNQASGKSTAEILKKAVGEEGKKVCVFPEGTTSLRGRPWKPGVFRVAQELQVPLQPFCIRYRPAHRAAFESPSMLLHCLNINNDGHLDVILTVGPKVLVKDPQKECTEWDSWNKELLHKSLKEQGL